MKSILKELWFGNIAPSERPYNGSTEYQKKLDNCMKKREKLCKTLTEQQLKLLEDYDDALEDCSSILSAEAFATGYGFGAKITMEVMEQE